MLIMTERHITTQFYLDQLFASLSARHVASSVSPADLVLHLRTRHAMQTHTVLSTLLLSG